MGSLPRAPTVSGAVAAALALLVALASRWLAASAEAQASPVAPEDVAAAQATLELELASPADVAEAASIETELQVAVGLHVGSAVLVTGGGIVIVYGLMALSTEGDDAYRVGLAEFVAGLVSVPLGAIAFAIAVGLEIDGVSRRDALRRRLSLSAGPGLVGLTLSLEL